MMTFKQYLTENNRQALLTAARTSGVAQQFIEKGGYSKASNDELEKAIMSHPEGAAYLKRALLAQKAKPYLDEVEEKEKIFIPSTTLDYEDIKTWLINYAKKNNDYRKDGYRIIWNLGPLGLRLEKQKSSLSDEFADFDNMMMQKYANRPKT